MADVKAKVKTPKKKASKREKKDWIAAYILIAPVTLGLLVFCEKKTAKAVFFGEGISLMGCSKNYIMYWGVFTVIIIACSPRKVCTNMDF